MVRKILVAVVAIMVIVGVCVFAFQLGPAEAQAASVNSAIIATEESTMPDDSSQTVASGIIQKLSDTQFNPGDIYLEKQWAIENMGLAALWAVTTGSPEIIVAVLDTGIDKDHEDLSGQIVGEVNFTDSSTVDDIYGHGTHIAGIIAAKSNDIGIVGIAPDVRLLNVKVVNDRGRCQVSDLVEGIIWAVDNGADVINISIEISEPSSAMEDAVKYAWDNGVIIVAAAGNGGSQIPVYPAFYDNCLAVAAVNESDNLAPLSNTGSWVDLAAPGYKIYSTFPGNEYKLETGTSFATAQVSGIAALLFTIAVDSNMDGFLNDEILTIINESCQDIGLDGVGWGCIDAAQIVVS